MSKTQANEIINLEELAALLRITETTAYQLVRSGEIPGRKVGREWRFLREQVFEWLKHGGKDEGEKMDHVVYRDEWGGEYSVENGEEKVALWIPLSLKEKEALMKKAIERQTSVSQLVSEYLKNWMAEAE